MHLYGVYVHNKNEALIFSIVARRVVPMPMSTTPMRTTRAMHDGQIMITWARFEEKMSQKVGVWDQACVVFKLML